MTANAHTQDPSGSPELDGETLACRALWAEVFRLGLRETISHCRREGRFTAWFESDARHPGSIGWLCDIFGFDIDVVRSRIRARVAGGEVVEA